MIEQYVPDSDLMTARAETILRVGNYYFRYTIYYNIVRMFNNKLYDQGWIQLCGSLQI